jgi:hypothetical protein
MSNFRVVMDRIDLCPLLQQIDAHHELWNTNSVRTSVQATVHYDVDDIILRYPKPGLTNWNLEPFSILSEAQALVFALCSAVRCELLGRVVISRLGPGKQIPPHEDHIGLTPMFYSRYQIPLYSKKGVDFHCGDEILWMMAGNVYWFNNTITHSVINNSDEDRLSMIIDIRPFTPFIK